MKDIKIFQCTGNENDKIPDTLLNDLGISFEEANYDTHKMVALSKKVKEYQHTYYCFLPFCHTVEAEAFGSSVLIDNEAGNRISKYAINGRDEFYKIRKIDFSSGRISKILESAHVLKGQGEKVCLNIMGPISLATSIMDSQLFYGSIRRDKDSIIKLLDIIEDSIVEFIKSAVSLGVDIISFADPTGTIDIVGPKVYKEISGESTYKILKRIENKLGDTVVHICGKTSTSLEAMGLLGTEEIKMEGNSYGEMLDRVRREREDVKFIGHWCMKLYKTYSKFNIYKCILI